MRLELGLEQKIKLTQKQQITLQLQTWLPGEFAPFINLDLDGDRGLLEKSLSFLSLHELSHVLHHKSLLYVVKKEDYREIARQLQKDHGLDMGNTIHDLTETAIDKSAFVVGQEACDHTAEELVNSHIALLSRVYRDGVERQSVPTTHSFMARSHAGLKFYRKQGFEQVEELEKNLRKYGKNIDGWSELVKLYSYTFDKSTTKRSMYH